MELLVEGSACPACPHGHLVAKPVERIVTPGREPDLFSEEPMPSFHGIQLEGIACDTCKWTSVTIPNALVIVQEVFQFSTA